MQNKFIVEIVNKTRFKEDIEQLGLVLKRKTERMCKGVWLAWGWKLKTIAEAKPIKINPKPVKENGKTASENNINGHDIAGYIHSSVPGKQTNKQIKPKQQQNPTKKKIKENVLLVKLKIKIK